MEWTGAVRAEGRAETNREKREEIRAMAYATPPQPVHIPGTTRGEEFALNKGKEPGRKQENGRGYRSARDSTGINAGKRRPIHPDMLSIPPS